MNKHTIVGGKEVEIGMRVFTNDWKWGTVLDTPANRLALAGVHTPGAEHEEVACTAWFDVELDNGVVRIYDCSRMATKEPR